MPARSTVRERYSFANLDEVLDLPDLIAIQRENFAIYAPCGTMILISVVLTIVLNVIARYWR